jgi:hypothetical protein
MATPGTYYRFLQDAAVSGNGTTLNPSETNLKREHAFYVRGNGALSAGAVQIETSVDGNDSGTWAPLGTAVTLVANTTSIVQITGALLAVRARITTAVDGGTVTVVYVGN